MGPRTSEDTYEKQAKFHLYCLGTKKKLVEINCLILLLAYFTILANLFTFMNSGFRFYTVFFKGLHMKYNIAYHEGCFSSSFHVITLYE